MIASKESIKVKANQLIKEAEKKLSPGGILGFFFGGPCKAEEAADCYQKAGNLLKIASSWEQAAESYLKAANLLAKTVNKHEAAMAYVDSALCYKKFDNLEAENCYLKAIEIYLDMGRFTVAAKHHQTIAEMYEGDPSNYDKVIQHFEQASDYFRGEESVSCANRCLLKVALYSAELENYSRAVVIYEEIVKYSLDNSLLKYSAKEYFFRAMLCHLCVDIPSSSVTLERYCQLCPAFTDTRECKFVRKLLENIDEQNLDGMTAAIKEFDMIQCLDSWYTMMLLRIKNKLSGKMDLR